MRSRTWNETILGAHRAYLQTETGRQSFDALVSTAVAMTGYETAPGWHGHIRDFHYDDLASGERPFAFIVNRNDLLFYVRAAGLRRVSGGFAALKRRFPSTKENSRGEWTVRIASEPDVERLNQFLFLEPVKLAAHEGGIPDGITHNDVLHAIKCLNAGVAHDFAESVKYDLVYEGRRYAPKAVIGLAAQRLAGRKLGPYDFKGGEESKCFRLLESLGYSIGPKAKSATSPLAGPQWRTDQVSAGQVFEEMLAGYSADTRIASVDALQASILFARTHYPDRWLLTLHPSYVRFIAGMVMCLQFTNSGESTVLLLKALAPAKIRRNGGEYKNAPGCVEVEVPVEEFVTTYPLLQMAHQAAILTCLETSATAGGHRRAHSPGLVSYLENLSELGAHKSVIAEKRDRIAVQKLLARTDIGPTEKQTLVNARRGQGLFREKVIELERKCRVTGVKLTDHLRASHIKPWKDSTDQEKLDGNNGLLLAPHIDHLFDRGFISFSDVGDLIVSKQCPMVLFKTWAVDKQLNVGPFRIAQRPYLAHHRKIVLRQ